MCSSNNLAIVGSWSRRRDIHRHTWISNDGRKKKELDLILTKDIGLIKQYKVYREAEPQQTHFTISKPLNIEFS